MKITVKNLGPIKEATVDLADLTVFVGENGTGKSYLAKVVYGLLNTETFSSIFFSHTEQFQQIIFQKVISTNEEAILALQALTIETVNSVLPNLANLYAEIFKENLSEYFNDDSHLFSNTIITYSNLEKLSNTRLKNIINDLIEKNSTEPKIRTTNITWEICFDLFFI